MPSFNVDVEFTGPVFKPGLANAAGYQLVRDSTRKLADTGRDWIRIAANAMDKSGRGGTGRAAEGVIIYERDAGYAIFGEMTEGQVWWPWLEGVSERNRSTRFPGYHTFRTTRRLLADHAQEIIQPEIDTYVREMGGG